MAEYYGEKVEKFSVIVSQRFSEESCNLAGPFAQISGRPALGQLESAAPSESVHFLTDDVDEPEARLREFMSKNEIDAAAVMTAAAVVVTKEAYGDVAKPSASIVGDQLALVPRWIRTMLYPLQRRILEAEHDQKEWLENELGKRVEAIPEGRLQHAPPQLAEAVLRRIPLYDDEPELRAMYARLLAASMDSDLSHGVHRSYAHIIEQITPAEARLLNVIHNLPDSIVAKGSARRVDGWDADGAEFDLLEGFFSLCESAGISDEDRSRNAYDNLLRLRLLRIERTSSSKVQKDYEVDGSYYREFALVTVENVALSLSDYGTGFLDSCVADHHIGSSGQPAPPSNQQ